MTGCADLLRFLRDRGILAVVVSNGLERLGLRLAEELPFARVLANRELVADNTLTGELEIVVPYDAKGQALLRTAAELDVAPAHIMAVGDGSADINMFRNAARSVAFLPENEQVAAAADHVLEQPDLRRLMTFLD